LKELREEKKAWISEAAMLRRAEKEAQVYITHPASFQKLTVDIGPF
jgi:methylase of polypeptide subunit release factors